MGSKNEGINEDWSIIIKPKTGLFEVNIAELIKYRDLIFLFVKRSFSAQYKQTILGPLWFLINPLLTTVMFTLIFGNIAGFSTDGVPQFAFYLCSTAIWQYFSTCLTETSNTFTTNKNIFGKVYFPRLTIPIATVIFSLINFLVVFAAAIVTIVIYMFRGEAISLSWHLLLVPVLVLQTAMLGLGVGIMISSLTTKYRDLKVLVSFGVQLWMYGTPVVYTPSQLPNTLRTIVMLNPVSPIVVNFRYAMMGCGTFETGYWGISIITTLILLMIGVLMFNKVEKNFMDTV
jgi:lipopolysaccharide transport system permease protein